MAVFASTGSPSGRLRGAFQALGRQVSTPDGRAARRTTLVVLALLGFNTTHLGVVPGAGVLRPVLVVLAVAVMVLGGLMLVITANFSFRAIDTARIAVASVIPSWRVSTGVLALGLVA